MGVSSRTLQLFASAVVILNLFDAAFTLIYVHAGVATEGNPMMQSALSASPVVFMLAKLTLVSLCVALLFRLGKRKPAMVALASATVMYALVIGYHLAEVPRLVATL